MVKEKVTLLRYDWILLRFLTKGNNILAAKILLTLFLRSYKPSKATRAIAEKYHNAKNKRTINFLVEGVQGLTNCHYIGVSLQHIGDYIELAAYRDLNDFQKTRKYTVERLIVLDILETMDISDNPIINITDGIINFTCEHL